MVGPYMLLLCLYYNHLIIASDLCLILNHIQIIKIFFYAVLWKCLFDIEYTVLKTFIYGTSTMAYLVWSYCTLLHSFLFNIMVLLDWCVNIYLDHIKYLFHQ